MQFYLLGLIGMWLFSDGLYSILFYLNEPGLRGKMQTWRRDHWIRVVRCILGIMLIIIGGMNA